MPITSDVEQAIIVVSYGWWNITNCFTILAIIAMNEFVCRCLHNIFGSLYIYLMYIKAI